MIDGRQGISLDRWLIRIKDILQILTVVGAIFWGGIKFIRALDDKDRKIEGLQAQISQLKIERVKQKRRF